MEKKTVLIGVKVTPSTKEKIEKLAQEQNRSVSNLISMLIEQYIQTGSQRLKETEEEKVVRLIKMIEQQGQLTMTSLQILAAENGLSSTLRRMDIFAEKLLEEHNQQIENTQE